MIVKTGIHDEDALAAFMLKEQSVREPHDFVQWRTYYFEDYSATESVYVMKIHHSLADGVSLIFFNSLLGDNCKV